MNYLGHAYLSFDRQDGARLTGNLIGDHIKGRLALAQYPEAIQQGILLHRKIDEYADNHPATKRAKLFFRQDYGLYAGAIMDTLYDHFLANDPKVFVNQATLLAFSEEVYTLVTRHSAFLPPAFQRYFPHMQEHNWLFGYRNTRGMENALQGLARRAKHMPPPAKAYELFITHFYQLNQCYFELIDNITAFVKIELNL